MVLQKFQTLTEAKIILHGLGFNLQFNLCSGYLHCIENELNFHPHELSITEVYSGHPGENAVLYTIESEEHGLKGLLLNGI